MKTETKETQGKLIESEWDGIVRNNDAKRFVELMKTTEPLPEAERKRIRENYEAMARISSDYKKENQSLRSELQKAKDRNNELNRSAQQLKEYREKLKEAIRIIEKLQNSWISAEHYWGSETNEITDTFLDATKILIVGGPKQGQDQQPPEQEP